ncbi:hypothetical protein GYMLUDRAFT_64112 [Collybiopsis luxurians FD-317 M1]|uniref:Uncharacterized protein n=1 Tax=Collybiopsis luxurians FD-317 M1 TaxID=944289 RepID=A0A0D0C4A4_9AGAR|nr:hypothetical protein GYMLUDRAFT_64112 [Collybiopsis luxurians FD-317 M1]
MSSLRRTESFLCLSDMQNSCNKSHPPTATASVRRSSKSERDRRKSIIDFAVSTTAAKPSPPVPCATPTPQRSTPTSSSKQYPNCSTYRSSSPLSPNPNRTVLPGRPIFPRSKQEPDLYRQAIIARMRCSPEGQRILHMGPKLALSIMSATRELERLVAAQGEREDNDVVMADATAPTMSASWVVVPPAVPESRRSCHYQDWEMVNCGA